MSITPLPSAPAVTDTTSEFNTKAFNWVAALDPFTTEANALLATCEDAAMTASAAIALVGAEAWVSGTTYAIGDSVYSPIDMQTYRRKTNGGGTTDPSADSTNWEKIAFNAPTATQAEMEAGTSTTVKSVTPERIKQAIVALTPPPTIRTKVWTAITSTSNYTVPSGATSIRVYAVGGGGDGGLSNYYGSGGGGGGGGGIAYGDIAVTPGQTVTCTISSGVATVTYNGTTMLTANKGSNGSAGSSSAGGAAAGGAGGAGGTATKHASVTNGGTYTGGTGGAGGNTSNQNWYSGPGGGGSAASPLGNGYVGGIGSTNNSQGSQWGGGGAGIGGKGADSGWFGSYGGGGGGAGSAGTGSRGGSSISTGFRKILERFADPLLSEAFYPNQTGTGVYQWSGAGGNSQSDTYISEKSGGDFGGGAGNGYSNTVTSPGSGGLLGGGGGGGGSGGYGGGGGGSSNATAGTTVGTGGAAIILIYA